MRCLRSTWSCRSLTLSLRRWSCSTSSKTNGKFISASGWGICVGVAEFSSCLMGRDMRATSWTTRRTSGESCITRMGYIWGRVVKRAWDIYSRRGRVLRRRVEGQQTTWTWERNVDRWVDLWERVSERQTAPNGPDGSEYEGNFYENMFNGEGKYTWNDKRDYIGKWSINQMNGYEFLVGQMGGSTKATKKNTRKMATAFFNGPMEEFLREIRREENRMVKASFLTVRVM